MCECGTEKIVTSDSLSCGKTKSCGCLKREVLAKRGNQWGLFEDREKALLSVQYSHLKRRNTKKGFTDVISLDEFSFMSKMPCEYCGLEYSKEIEDRLSMSKNQRLLSDHILKCNGIDRVDCSKGYTTDNTVPCCKTCNFAKRTMSRDEFISWIERVYAFTH